MTWQGVSEAECYDNRSVMAQIMRLKDRVRVLEEGGSGEIEQEIEEINEQLTILEGKVGGLEEGAAGLAEDVAALESGKADKSQLTDGSVTKIGTATVGSQTSPIYINQGVPTTTGVEFLKVGRNDIGNSDIDLDNNQGLNTVGSLNLKKAELVTPNDVYYRRWPSWTAGATAMWGWEIPIQNEADNAFDMEVDVIRENLYGENYEVYSRFRLTTNGVKQLSVGSNDDPPVLKFVCEFGDPSMACVARLTPEHWTTDYTIWRLFIRVNIQSASGNSMPAVRINRVLSKKPIFFPVLPAQMHCQYEDVTYGGETIPNVTNYTYYDWIFPTQQGGGGGGGTYYAGTGLTLANDTFSLNSATQSTLAQVANKADDSAVVKLTGTQSVAGVKTFSDSPIVPTPTTDYQVATKKYVDDNAGGGGSGTWTVLQPSDYTSAKFQELFYEGSKTLQALKDINIVMKMGTNDMICSETIPKGAYIHKALSFIEIVSVTSTSAGFTFSRLIDIKAAFYSSASTTTVMTSYALTGVTNTTTTAATVKGVGEKVTYADIAHQSTAEATTSGKLSVFIQYR